MIFRGTTTGALTNHHDPFAIALGRLLAGYVAPALVECPLTQSSAICRALKPRTL